MMMMMMIFLVVQSSLTLSFHFFLGLPLGRWPCVYPWSSIWGNLSFSIRVTWPKYVNLRICRALTVSFLIDSFFNISRFRLRSLLVTPQIFLNNDISKTFDFCFFSFFRVHVCVLHRTMDNDVSWSDLYSTTSIHFLHVKRTIPPRTFAPYPARLGLELGLGLWFGLGGTCSINTEICARQWLFVYYQNAVQRLLLTFVVTFIVSFDLICCLFQLHVLSLRYVNLNFIRIYGYGCPTLSYTLPNFLT